MATIFEFTVPADEFALEETLIDFPEAVVEIERVVADNPGRITPYVWVRADDIETLEAAFKTDPTIEELTMLSGMDDERSYQMTWAGPVD